LDVVDEKKEWRNSRKMGKNQINQTKYEVTDGEQ
jgi:hypothetical protein